jgi:hypothetical protein
MWVTCHSALVWASLVCHSFAGLSSSVHHLNHVRHRDSVASRQPSLSPSVATQNVSSGDIEAARRIVKDAIAKMTELNKARLAKPTRNNFRLKPGTKSRKRDDEAPPPLLEITDEIARAAALVAEVDVDPSLNTTLPPVAKRAGTFWMESIAHKGTVPWGNDASYKVCAVVSTLEKPLRLLI